MNPMTRFARPRPVRHDQLAAAAPDRPTTDDTVATVGALRALANEGNVRRIFLDDADGTLIEIPMVLGVGAGPRLEAVWAAAAYLARLRGRLTIRVHREQAWPPTTERDRTITVVAEPSLGGAPMRRPGSRLLPDEVAA